MSGLTAEQIERLANALHDGISRHAPEARRPCPTCLGATTSLLAPVVAALIAEAVEQARGEDLRSWGHFADSLAIAGLGYREDDYSDGARQAHADIAQTIHARIARGEVSP